MIQSACRCFIREGEIFVKGVLRRVVVVNCDFVSPRAFTHPALRSAAWAPLPAEQGGETLGFFLLTSHD